MIKTGLRIVAVLILLSALIVIALGLYLSSGKTLEQWHTPSEFTELFDYGAGSFAEYKQWSERRILATRTDSPSADVVANLLPFELEPDSDCPVNTDGKYPNGIVLVHGLIASPWSMKAMGEFFRSRCFFVLGVLLPGHGSRVGDMLESTWEAWHQDVQFATAQLAEKVDRLYLSGHSAGATLTVYEAALNPSVDALILFAPSMQVDQASKYAGAVSLLGNLFPKAAWFELEPEDGIYRYESFPFSAAAQTWSLIQATREALAENPLNIPILTIASAQDTTVDAQATLDFMTAQNNPLSFTLLYSQYSLPPYLRTRILNSNSPEQGVLSVGHLGLMTPPEHPHYGRDGDYRYCAHYFGVDVNAFDRCKAGERDYYGETTARNLQSGLIERIAFNPFYDDLLAELDLFIEQIGLDRRGVPLQRNNDAVLPGPEN